MLIGTIELSIQSPTVIDFEWDPDKERHNILAHGISFSTASSVFYDLNRVEIYDEAHSDNEDRYVTFGSIGQRHQIMMVVYTVRNSNTIRIISARLATNKEKENYYDRA